MTRDEFIALACQVAEELAQRFEGLFLTPYLCPAGIPTIGYGATYYLDGRPVTLKDPAITKTTALIMLRHMVRYVYLPAVLKLCPNVRDPRRLAALVDFAFNLGIGRLKASTLRRKVNAEEWTAVPGELMKWIRGAGKVLKGLFLRRKAEAALI